MRTEESQPITFHITYLNPDNPDPNPPRRIVKDRWQCVRLGERIPFTVQQVVKLAKASDPRSSSLAVCHDANGHPYIWGLVDQGNQYYDFVTYNSDHGPEQPGLFCASISGVGRLVVYLGRQKVAELRVDSLLSRPMDVFHAGPIYEALSPGILAYLESLYPLLKEKQYKDRLPWIEIWTSSWLDSLCRLLLRIQSLSHGGALLITPDAALKGVNVKYRIMYPRLRSALSARARMEIRLRYASEQIIYDYLSKSRSTGSVPVRLYLDETVAHNELDEIESECDGTIWFIGLLSRVDGAVVMNPRLDVMGYGAEILVPEEPGSVFLAGDAKGRRRVLKKVDYSQYGTRHRSMMRYCSKVTGSVGFVVSQDGDIRAMTEVGGHLVMWDNIRAQVDDREARTGGWIEGREKR